MKWQPIDTAPGGQPIMLVWYADLRWMDILYCADGVWRDRDGETYTRPTHWTPLPAPPAAEQEPESEQGEREWADAFVAEVMDVAARAEGFESYRDSDWSPAGLTELREKLVARLLILRSDQREAPE